MVRHLVGLAAAASVVAASSMAEAQRANPSPPYEDILEAVSNADCEKTEARTYLRFICREGRAVWYLTREGQAAHPAYSVYPAFGVDDRMPNINGSFGSGNFRTNSQEALLVRQEAFKKWHRQIFDIWSETKPRLEDDEAAWREQRKQDKPRLRPAE